MCVSETIYLFLWAYVYAGVERVDMSCHFQWILYEWQDRTRDCGNNREVSKFEMLNSMQMTVKI